MRLKLLCAALLLLGATCGFSQETTAVLSGHVTDAKGTFLPGTSIVLKHEPTGSVASTQVNSKGMFTISNLKPGGPYTLSVSALGFAVQTFKDINLVLGANPDLNISLNPITTELKEVVVNTGSRKAAAGGLVVGKTQLSTLPSIGRSLSDFTRLTPQSNNNSFAGSNFRYNNVTLDGAINNDAIGFSNSFGGVSGGGTSGTAGAGTRTVPYSIEAIQEVQVQLAPYDVKLGNFTGGSVNAVTKSGSNQSFGSVYFYGRNQALVGKSVDGTKSKIGADFYDYQTGISQGGAIVKNKAFYFLSAELTRRHEPTFYNAGDPGSAIDLVTAQSISGFMKTKYGYDLGGYDRTIIETNSDKLFGRFDFNLSARSSLMVRGLYTHGWGNNIERSSTNFQFGSTDFTQHTKNLNLVAELKTRLNDHTSNQLIASYINVKEYRSYPGVLAPFIDIGGGQIWAGTWREASVYNMKQQTVELTDNLSFNKGIHKFLIGTHNEFYKLSYGFLNSWNGRWEYASVANFLNDRPSRIRGTFTLDPAKNDYTVLSSGMPNSTYNVSLLSAYAQDEASLSRVFKLTYGIRLDYPSTPSQPGLDPAVTNTPDYSGSTPATYNHTPFASFNNRWYGKAVLSPRVGFNYDINGNQSLVLRGGSGIFVGRLPFAWLGYAYTLNGLAYGNIDQNNINIPVNLAMDPRNLRDTVSKYFGAGASNRREVDMIDNNFKMPRIWRSNIALDWRFGKGYKLTFDVMYTKTLYDVLFQQINLKDSTTYFVNGPTQTPRYLSGPAFGLQNGQRINNAFSNFFLLTNTREGYRYNFTIQFSKVTSGIRIPGGDMSMSWSAAYTYGLSKDLANGIRNSFQSNFEVNPQISPNNPMLGYSNFDLRHRIVGTFSAGVSWKNQQSSNIYFVLNMQSGSPYSFIYNTGANPFGNGINANLPFIPADRSQITLVDNGSYTADQQWNDLNNFINNDPYLKKRKGQYAERNGARTPWNNTLDMKLVHTFHFKGDNRNHALTFSLDIFNVLNLINNNWGHIAFVPNTNNYTVSLLRYVSQSNGIPGFYFTPPPATGTTPGKYYTVDPINSRWQGQFGVKYTF